MTKTKSFRLAVIAFAAVAWALSNPAEAQFPPAGARAVGMGGAQVAVVDDGTAAWSNPAALSGLKGWNLTLLASGVGYNRNNLVGTLDSLANLPFDEIAAGERPDLLPELIADIEALLQPDTSVIFSGVAGLGVAYKGFSLSIGSVPFAGIYPSIDLTHIIPGGGPDNGLEFNETGLNLVGLSAREVRLAYGYGFLGGTVSVGGAARLVFGRTYFARCGVFDPCQAQDISDLINDAFKENAVDTTEFTFDLGAHADLGPVRLGIVGVALNQPDFNVAVLPGAPPTVPLPRQLRAGAAVDPLPFLTIAADGDLIQSDTLAPGAQSQQLSLGAEVRIPFFAFRGGALYDFAATNPTWAYSLGVGIGVPIFSVDLAVLFSPAGGVDPTDLDREVLGGGATIRVHF